MKKNVLITGGTGFVGRKLTQQLLASEYTVSILTRSAKQNSNDVFYYKWDIGKQEVDKEAVINADYIIHLAGANIADHRWTPRRKKEIIDSREKSIALIHTALVKYDKRPEAFISASAIGIYGAINGKAICTEKTAEANDFLGVTCKIWEAATDHIAALGIRTVKIRTGLVLGENEGILKKLKPLFKNNVGAALGSGEQYMPWIHIDDLCAIYLHAIENVQLVGPYNAAINDSTTNLIFSKAFAKVYGHSLWMPNVPAFVLKLGLGEMSKMLLKGRRVSSDKIESTGFNFLHKKLKKTLELCLQK